MSLYAKRDAQRYVDQYPNALPDNLQQNKNLKFYSNEIQSTPNGEFIETIHKKWFGKYKLLEAHHGFIQWLFPIRESGVNGSAQTLQLHEAEEIASDPALSRRVLASYELMLNFYGIRLLNRESGIVERHYNWQQRYQHLNSSSHNYLRITRILKSLGELGFEHYKVHLVKHFLTEIYLKNQLRNCKRSAKDYWVSMLRNPKEREAIIKFIKDNQESDEEEESEKNQTSNVQKSENGTSSPTKDQKGSKRKQEESESKTSSTSQKSLSKRRRTTKQ